MTLKEIYKIIDEADLVIVYNLDEEHQLYDAVECGSVGFDKDKEKDFYAMNNGRVGMHCYYKIIKETGELKLLAKIDRIDRGKLKAVKLKEYRRKLCKDYVTGGCDYCISYDKKLKMCFFDIRKVYREMKNFVIHKEDEE